MQGLFLSLFIEVCQKKQTRYIENADRILIIMPTKIKVNHRKKELMCVSAHIL